MSVFPFRCVQRRLLSSVVRVFLLGAPAANQALSCLCPALLRELLSTVIRKIHNFTKALFISRINNLSISNSVYGLWASFIL
jgi:hypothetical protein